MNFLAFYVAFLPADVLFLIQKKKKKRTNLFGDMTLVDIPPTACSIPVYNIIPPKQKRMYFETKDETLNFPFLTNSRTVRRIKNGKTLFLLRGLPGSGKSTIVQHLQSVYPNSVKCSADDFFLVNGKYHFDHSKLKEAHSECQRKAGEASQRNIPVIIIDNTNVKCWEMKFYLGLARQANYTVVLVKPKTLWQNNPDELARRNKHSVSADILREKILQFQEALPIYYGWFLTESSTRDIQLIVRRLYSECLSRLPGYRQLQKDTSGKHHNQGGGSDKKKFPWCDSTPLLHCTAKFCNKGRAEGASAYIHRQDVQENIGKASELTIVGFTFTSETVAARVSLDEEQFLLFDKPEERARDEITMRNTAVQARVGQSRVPDSTEKRIRKMFARERKSPLLPPHGFGRSAHFTVCLAENIHGKQTLEDILDICDLEKEKSSSLDFVPVTGGVATHLADSICIVYLFSPLTVTGLYSAYVV